MIVVLNEWIFHDLYGRNGDHMQREAALFLGSLVRSVDILVVPSEPRWIGKANGLMRFMDARRRAISKVFRSLYDDSDRTIRIQADMAEDVPDHLLSQLPVEDVYLVSAYLSADADVLVTTDVPLHESLVGSDLVTCRMRDDFLADY